MRKYQAKLLILLSAYGTQEPEKVTLCILSCLQSAVLSHQFV